MNHRHKNHYKPSVLLALLLALMLSFTGCGTQADTISSINNTLKDTLKNAFQNASKTPNGQLDTEASILSDEILSSIPEWSGDPVHIYNGNQPMFANSKITVTEYEDYATLDSLGRTIQATACLGPKTLPTEERGDISSVKPTGWQSIQSDLVDGGWLYNRCHLIAHELSAEDDNKNNLITGTRYMNIEGMLPYENMVRNYINETGNHVMYRSTPLYRDDELVCRTVLLEGLSCEDNGEGIAFCIICYNVQPGFMIDYATGNASETESGLMPDNIQSDTPTGTDTNTIHSYITNTKSMVIHDPECPSAAKIASQNKGFWEEDIQSVIDADYKPCGQCKPDQT